MIKWYKIEDNTIKTSDEENAAIFVVANPSSEEIGSLCKEFDLNEHTVNSALDPDELSRIEFDIVNFSIIFKRPKRYSANDIFLFRVASIGLFIYNAKLIIILSEELPLFDSKLFNKVGDIKDILLRLLFLSISHFIEHLKVINIISDQLEEKINASMENKHLINMFALEKSLVYYLNAIQSNTATIEKMKHLSPKIGFDGQELEFLDDITIENQQCYKQAEIYSNVLTGLMDARGSIVNNNLNLLIKRLTIINVVFMPLNLIAGIGGMSEFSMMTKHIDWRIAYPIFIIGMALVGFLFYLLMRYLSSGSLKKIQ